MVCKRIGACMKTALANICDSGCFLRLAVSTLFNIGNVIIMKFVFLTEYKKGL